MTRRRLLQNILVILAFYGTGAEGIETIYYENQECKCVPYYYCKDGKIVTDGGPVIVPRSLIVPNNEGCGDPEHVYCCLPKPTEPPQVLPTKCGRRNKFVMDPRLSSGDMTGHKGEFPWMIALFKTSAPFDVFSTNLEYLSGGALIHESIVLTSAHSVFSLKRNLSDELIARAGEWDIQNDNEFEEHQDRKVAEIIAHPRFSPRHPWYDLAILKLVKPFDLRSHINIICLPPPGTIVISGKCIITSWGKEKYYYHNQKPSVLKKIDIDVVNRSRCTNQTKVPEGHLHTLHDSFICANGNFGIDTCEVDGGSPLACPSDQDGNTYELSGFVLSKSTPCRNGNPRVYAGVGIAHEWIENTKNNLGYK